MQYDYWVRYIEPLEREQYLMALRDIHKMTVKQRTAKRTEKQVQVSTTTIGYHSSLEWFPIA